MKWQKLLTKKQLAHFRYATNGVMSLERFKDLRAGQARIEAEALAVDPKYPIACCYVCDAIERRLREGGKL